MRVAIYARVSTTRQAQTQTIEQQLTRLQTYAQEQGWSVEEQHLYRDDGYSGASLHRPGLDRLRDRAALAELDLVLITAPDRLARKYVHQVLLLEELEQHGCRVEFLDRPMSQDPHDQLLLQIRGAVAEYERTLIAERMRRGRLAKLRAGQLLPWIKPPFGYRADPERPRDPRGLRVEESEGVVVQQIFARYLEEGATLCGLAKRLTDEQIPTPTGQPCWSGASVRGLLRNPAYTGTAYANHTQAVPARQRKSALRPVGAGRSRVPRSPEEWIPLSVPALVSQETFDLVQAKLAHNQRTAARNNKSHDYLLRGLVSCGRCQRSATARMAIPGYPYYVCQGRTDALRAAQGPRCTARYAPTAALDELVWQDLCFVLTQPEPLAQALERAQGGHWLPQELQARQTQVRQALAQVERQQQRLLEAYLTEVLELAEFERKRAELTQRSESLGTQQRQLEAQARQRLELSAVAESLEAFCAQVRAGLDTATFAQRRTLVELLIDRVIVTDGQVEIRYVLPTSPEGSHYPFCHLRKDYFGADRPAKAWTPGIAETSRQSSLPAHPPAPSRACSGSQHHSPSRNSRVRSQASCRSASPSASVRGGRPEQTAATFCSNCSRWSTPTPATSTGRFRL
jgi:site-specific DNA recombinase